MDHDRWILLGHSRLGQFGRAADAVDRDESGQHCSWAQLYCLAAPDQPPDRRIVEVACGGWGCSIARDG